MTSPTRVGDFFYLVANNQTMAEERFQSFQEFYPFYLSEHKNKTSRTLHFIGTFLVFLLLGFFIAVQKEAKFWIALPLVGYGFAWVGHAFFEKNSVYNLSHLKLGQPRKIKYLVR